jgi:hypothetical protein
MYELGGEPRYITAVAEVTTDGVSVGTVFDSTGKERVSAMPYGYDVAEGNIANHIAYDKMGLNEDIDADEEDLWFPGGTYIFPTSGMQMEIYCNSTNDVSTGTGAHSVNIAYLTSDFVQHSTSIVLTSTNPVPTGATDIYRINNVKLESAGSLAKSAGYIDIRSTAGTPIYSRIPASGTRARNAIYTVPHGYDYYVAQNTYSIGNSGNAKVFGRFSMKTNWNIATSTIGDIFFPISEIGITDAVWTAEYAIPLKIRQHTDIRVTCKGDAVTANAVASVQYRGWLEPS